MGSVGPTCHLLGLPREILSQILCFLHPTNLIAFGQTCQTALLYISPKDQILWRDSFLQAFDDPFVAWSALLPSARSANASQEAHWDWYARLRERCIALQSIATADKIQRRTHMERNADVLVNIIETAHNGPPSLEFRKCRAQGGVHPKDPHPSLNIRAVEEAFRTHPDAERSVHDFETDVTLLSTPSELLPGPLGRPFTRSMAALPFPVSETASRLHIYFGLTRRERSNPKAQSPARQLVYDWHLSGEDTDYGPFKRDNSGYVNWNLLEAVCSLIGRHFELLIDRHIGIPQGLRYAIPYQMKSDPSCPEDWASVTGSWLGTYSFLDYSVLHRFNVGYYAGARPALESCDEARGDLMHLELRLDDSLRSDPRLVTDVPVCEDLPMLYFSGTSRGHGASRPYILVRGTVSLIPGGRQVRWRFIIK